MRARVIKVHVLTVEALISIYTTGLVPSSQMKDFCFHSSLNEKIAIKGLKSFKIFREYNRTRLKLSLSALERLRLKTLLEYNRLFLAFFFVLFGLIDLCHLSPLCLRFPQIDIIGQKGRSLGSSQRVPHPYSKQSGTPTILHPSSQIIVKAQLCQVGVRARNISYKSLR